MAIPAAVLQDSDILPPQEGKHNHLALVAATASTAQDTGITGATNALGPTFITMSCNADWNVVFSMDGTSTVTVPVVATATCWPVAANTSVSFRVSPLQRYFRAISTAGGALKWYLSSPAGF